MEEMESHRVYRAGRRRLAWVVYLQVTSGKHERSYTRARWRALSCRPFKTLSWLPLFQADRDGLVKTAEDACTYRLDHHSETQTVSHLEAVSSLPASLVPLLAFDAEGSFCPEVFLTRLALLTVARAGCTWSPSTPNRAAVPLPSSWPASS